MTYLVKYVIGYMYSAVWHVFLSRNSLIMYATPFKSCCQHE